MNNLRISVVVQSAVVVPSPESIFILTASGTPPLAAIAPLTTVIAMITTVKM
jgi:hypothetical protein